MTAVEYSTYDGEKIVLDDSNIFACFSGGCTPTTAEVEKFANLCKTKRLNPFAAEIWLVKYKQEMPATIMVGKDGYLVLASHDSRYRGSKSGVILKKKDGTYENRTGSFYLKGEEILVGGWATVFVDGYQEPVEDTVPFSEYNSGKQLWASKPGSMIQKVALSHALRLAFPSIFSGTYAEGETDETISVASNEAVSVPKKAEKTKQEKKEKIVPVSNISVTQPKPMVEKIEEKAKSTEVHVEQASQAVNAADPVVKPQEIKLPTSLKLEDALNTMMSTDYKMSYLIDRGGQGVSEGMKVKALTRLNLYKKENTDRGEAARVILSALDSGSLHFVMAA